MVTYEDLIDDIVFKSEGCPDDEEIPEEIFKGLGETLNVEEE